METAIQTPFDTNFIGNNDENSSSRFLRSTTASCSFSTRQKEAELRNHVTKPIEIAEKDAKNDEFAKITRQMALDIVQFYVKKVAERKMPLAERKSPSAEQKMPPPFSAHARNMRRLVNEIIGRHDLVFSSMVTKELCLAEIDMRTTFRTIASQIFADGRRNWGRIVALFALVARLAQHLAERGLADDEYVLPLADYLAEYLLDELRPWMLNNGGWDGFMKHFPEDSNIESKILKGLLVTGIGLGVLATFFAAR